MKKNRIVFCIDSMGKGGAERVVSVLANEFIKENDVYIYTNVYGDCKYELNEKIVFQSLEEKDPLRKGKLYYYFQLIPSFFKRIKLLNRKFNEIKPDIIISFLPAASFFAVTANKNKFKLIISERNDPTKEYNNFLYNFLMKRTYPKANGFVFQTSDAKKYFDNIIDFNNKQYDIIYNPVNELFLKDENGLKKEKSIITFGRLFEQKNHELLLDAFKLIQKKYPDYKLRIIGDGPLKEKLENKIKDEKIKNAELPGTSNEVKQELLKSQIFVLTSNYEGMPNALIEAMCVGLPVISTDCPCGGPSELIENNTNGVLINVNDLEELTSSIERLIEDEKKRELLSINAKKIRTLVDPKTIVNKWTDLIKKIIKDDD